MPPLHPWMRYLLRFAGGFNLVAGAGMIGLYSEAYDLLGVPKPSVVMPVQVMGILVALFGVGYLLVARRPEKNRDLLMLGFWSKALSSVVALWYVVFGPLPGWFAAVVVLSDVVYLPPFFVILRHIGRQGTT